MRKKVLVIICLVLTALFAFASMAACAPRGGGDDTNVHFAQWLSGESVPDKDTGKNGDLYMDSETCDIYYKNVGVWTKIGNLDGTLEAGCELWIDAETLPKDTEGENGELYLDAQKGAVYIKELGKWKKLYEGKIEKKKKTLYFITIGESHTYWQTIRKGAMAAAQKDGYKVVFRGIQSVSGQKELFTYAFEDPDLAAIVFAPAGTGLNEELISAYEKKIPVVSFYGGAAADVTAGKDPIVSEVLEAAESSGALAAEKFYERCKTKIGAATAQDPYVVGVLRAKDTGRAKGFADKMRELAKEKIAAGAFEIYENVCEGYGATQAAMISSQKRQEGLGAADAVILADESSIYSAYPEWFSNRANYQNVDFCGFGAGTSCIDWIRAGGLTGSIAVDTYQIGYQAALQAIAAAQGKPTEKRVGVADVWFDSSNIDELIEEGIVYEG